MRCKLAILYIIVPCYNEEKVLPLTSEIFIEKIKELIGKKIISEKSKILFIDDGSRDDTWHIIKRLSENSTYVEGIKQSRNRGHQNAVWAGMMESKEFADIVISIDCDGQDDINAINQMIESYYAGSEVVYGVRSKRETDKWFKRFSAEMFYKILNKMGAETVYNHADYRLLSAKVIKELAQYREVNLFLRGMIPLVGFNSSIVYYERFERIAGESHYPLKKMLGLAVDGITSLSVKPLHFISGLGIGISLISMMAIVWVIIRYFMGHTVAGWASNLCIICFLGGIQLLSLGVIGEYIGKIYMEVKARPRYILSERTYEQTEENVD